MLFPVYHIPYPAARGKVVFPQNRGGERGFGMSFFYDKISSLPSVASIILSIALMMLSGFAVTRVTKRLRLPNVTGYILAGILLGPYVLHLVPQTIVEGMDFIADIALAFIAFSTGEFFRFSVLRKNGAPVVVITVLEACVASIMVFGVMVGLLHLSLPFSAVLAALAAATAPASTLMTIRQTGARGDFVETLLQVVALDDVVGLLAYSVAISVALAATSGSFQVGNVLLPILANLGTFALGGAFGILMKLMMPKKRSTDNRLIISVALLFSFCGICALLDVSPLLGCMSMGTVYINITGDDKLFKQLNYFSPPLLLLFFVRSGLDFQLDALFSASHGVENVPIVVVGVLYFLVRIAGKYAGAYGGCLLVHKGREVRNFLGLALIPQAGVAIGLAALGARELGGELGDALQTIILASSVLYELIGPVCAKAALYFSHSYGREAAVPEPAKEKNAPVGVSPVEQLVLQLRQIQGELPSHSLEGENEAAFLQAAEEQYAAFGPMRRPVFLNRR